MPERYEEEIDDLLRRMGFSGPPGRHRRPFWAGVIAYFRNAWKVRPSGPGQLMLASLALLLLAFILWSPLPHVARVIGPVGLFMLIVAYITSLVRPSGQYQKRWRGQVIELPRGNSWWDRFYRWLYRRR
ncbi:MAG: hypothetical protein HY677_03135 [Chloroflexi bacterium]|nr:hypothetical protein [Chloroflexota bacterium]